MLNKLQVTYNKPLTLQYEKGTVKKLIDNQQYVTTPIFTDVQIFIIVFAMLSFLAKTTIFVFKQTAI